MAAPKKEMGKGTVYLMGANALLLLTGYAVHFGLGRMLGPEEYGRYGIIISLLIVVEIFFTRGFRDAVSKFVAEFPSQERTIRHDALRTTLFLSIIGFAAYFLLAGPAAMLLGDDDLAPYIRLSSVNIPIMAVASIYLGHLSGLHRFREQAIALSMRHLGKLFAIFTLVLLYDSIYSAVSGYVIGIGVGLLAAMVFSHRSSRKLTRIVETQSRKDEQPDIEFDPRKLVTFALPLVVFSGLMTLLRSLDLLFVKALMDNDDAAGFYTSAWAISLAPYQLFIALSISLLPSISRSTSQKNLEQTRNYISRSLRYLLIIALPLVCLVSSGSEQIIELSYGHRYSDGAAPLSVLIFGIACLTIFYILSTIMTGSGDPRTPMIMAAILVVVSAVLNAALIPHYDLMGAAMATSLACAVGMIVSAVRVRQMFGVLVPRRSLIRIGIAAIPLFIIPHIIPVNEILFIPLAIFLLCLYGFLLHVLKEFTDEDRSFLSRLLPFSITGLTKR